MGLGLLLSIVISVIIGVRTLSTHQLLLSIMLAAFCTSNSFIIMEDQIALFLTQLLTSIIVLKNREKIQKKEFFLIGLQLIFSRISFTMRRCRPEQFWCYNSKYENFLTKENFLTLKDFINYNYKFFLPCKFFSLKKILTLKNFLTKISSGQKFLVLAK